MHRQQARETAKRPRNATVVDDGQSRQPAKAACFHAQNCALRASRSPDYCTGISVQTWLGDPSSGHWNACAPAEVLKRRSSTLLRREYAKTVGVEDVGFDFAFVALSRDVFAV